MDFVFSRGKEFYIYIMLGMFKVIVVVIDLKVFYTFG